MTKIATVVWFPVIFLLGINVGVRIDDWTKEQAEEPILTFEVDPEPPPEIIFYFDADTDFIC